MELFSIELTAVCNEVKLHGFEQEIFDFVGMCDPSAFRTLDAVFILNEAWLL
jgi:hypothetical protein